MIKLLLTLLLCLFPSTAFAEEIIQNFETGGDVALGIGDSGGTDYEWAIQVSLGIDYNITAVSLYVESETGDVVGDLTLRMETDTAGKPSGTLVHANATGTIADGDVNVVAWNKYSYTPFLAVAGTYWFRMYVPAQADNNMWRVTRDNDGGSGTNLCMSIDGGNSWSFHAAMGYHRIYGEIPAAAGQVIRVIEN